MFVVIAAPPDILLLFCVHSLYIYIHILNKIRRIYNNYTRILFLMERKSYNNLNLFPKKDVNGKYFYESNISCLYYAVIYSTFTAVGYFLLLLIVKTSVPLKMLIFTISNFIFIFKQFLTKCIIYFKCYLIC